MTTAGGPAREAILSDLAAIFRDKMGLDDLSPLDESTRFFADLGLASIDAVVLGESIQSHYSRTLPFGDLMAELGRKQDRDFAIGELVDFLERHLNPGR